MWTPPLWSPSVALSPAEQKVAARAAPRKKLFVFFRAIRGELFDDAFQEELLAMYRRTGAGKPPVPPALLAMATLLQAYTVSFRQACLTTRNLRLNRIPSSR